MNFDRDLRNLLFVKIIKVEEYIKCQLDNVMFEITKDIFWNIDGKNFKSSFNVTKAPRAALNRKNLPKYIKYYQANYTNSNTTASKADIPPFWDLAELYSFGTIVTIVENFEKIIIDSPKFTRFSKRFGAKNPSELISFMKVMRHIRNVCAHNSPIWIRNHFNPKLDHKTAVKGIHRGYSASKSKKIYESLVVIHVIMLSVYNDNSLKQDLISLFNKYPEAKSWAKEMGFENNWGIQDVWNNQ